MRVLLIEDDDSVRSAVRRALLLDGFEVVPAPTGQEGVLKAETVMPDAPDRSASPVEPAPAAR